MQKPQNMTIIKERKVQIKWNYRRVAKQSQTFETRWGVAGDFFGQPSKSLTKLLTKPSGVVESGIREIYERNHVGFTGKLNAMQICIGGASAKVAELKLKVKVNKIL